MGHGWEEEDGRRKEEERRTGRAEALQLLRSLRLPRVALRVMQLVTHEFQRLISRANNRPNSSTMTVTIQNVMAGSRFMVTASPFGVSPRNESTSISAIEVTT